MSLNNPEASTSSTIASQHVPINSLSLSTTDSFLARDYLYYQFQQMQLMTNALPTASTGNQTNYSGEQPSSRSVMISSSNSNISTQLLYPSNFNHGYYLEPYVNSSASTPTYSPNLNLYSHGNQYQQPYYCDPASPFLSNYRQSASNLFHSISAQQFNDYIGTKSLTTNNNLVHSDYSSFRPFNEQILDEHQSNGRLMQSQFINGLCK